MADGLQVSQSKLPEQFVPPDRSNEKYIYSQPKDYPETSGGLHSQQKEDGARHTRILPLVLAVGITAVVVGAAVGGGLGSQLSGANHCSMKGGSSTVTTVTVTATASVASSAAIAKSSLGLLEDYSPEPPSQIATVHLECPGRNKEQYITSYNPEVSPQRFTILCGRSLYQSDSGNLAQIVAYRLDDCIEACGDLAATDECHSVTFHNLMHVGSDPTPFNCWLFNRNTTGRADGNSAASAYLS